MCRADESRRKQQAAEAAFKAVLEQMELKPGASWRKVQSKVQDKEEYEVRNRSQSASQSASQPGWVALQRCLAALCLHLHRPAACPPPLSLQALDRVARLDVFQAHMRALEDADAQAREREKEARRRNERQNR